MISKLTNGARRGYVALIGRFIFLSLLFFLILASLAFFIRLAWLPEARLAVPPVIVSALSIIAKLIAFAALLYGAAFTFGAFRYLAIVRRQPPARTTDSKTPESKRRIAILYLCCGDLEYEALWSLSRLKYDGPILHILHDDSQDAEDRERVDSAVDKIEKQLGITWRVLRRSDKTGGKSAVTNHVLERTSDEHDFLLIADNDSFSNDDELLMKAIPLFDDKSISAVQFRNVAAYRPNERPFTRLLGGAIDMFDAFMTGIYRGLWQPFVGHNAILRTSELVECGAFTPGVFADDIELTVRMNRRGKRVEYCRDLCMGEYHPPNYRSFCERSSKWSTGCAQVLRMHGLNVLFDRKLSIAHKTGFFLFCGFYLTQAAIIGYVLIVLVLLPLLSIDGWKAGALALAVGTLLPVSIFFPVIAYLRTEGRHLPFWKTLGACAATYGSTDWWTLQGLRRGLGNQEARWIPTNNIAGGERQWSDWGHFGCGILALCIPLALQPALLLFPITWLFAAKLIFVPAVASHYR